MCLVLSGPILPPKTTNGANKAKAVVAKLVKRHLSYSLREQEIVDCSYLGKTNSIVVKFSKVGKGSDHENIISQCRDIGFLHFSKDYHFLPRALTIAKITAEFRSTSARNPLHRKLSPDGICVNIMEASCDSGMYFLLGCMQATGQISGSHLIPGNFCFDKRPMKTYQRL